MRDRALDITLMILFGVGGIIILVMSWAQPMLLSERIPATAIGTTGLVWTTARVLALRLRPALMVAKKLDNQDEVKESMFVEDGR